jgi:hypothetical protein
VGAVVVSLVLAVPPDDAALERRLQADPRLSGLTVSVVDGVAVVGGPVPTLEAKWAAEAAVNGCPELAAARLNLWVPAGRDPFGQRVEAALGPPKPAPKPKPPAPTGDGPPLALLLPGEWLTTPPPVPAAVTVERQTDRQPALGPPLAVELATIPPPQVPAAPPDRFATLTSSDPRFRRLTVDISPAGTAVIGGAGDPAAAWELAQRVRRQPGVRRVVVGPVADR